MNPFFSIIIPTYNRSDLLKKAIDSVINQLFKDWELIIVDDGSTDNTGKVVRSFDDLRIQYFFQENKERSAARNLGIQNAKGQYLCFLDDDDYFLETHLQNFYYYLSQNNFPNIILRAGYFKEFDYGRRIEATNYKLNLHKNPVHYAAYNMCGVWSLCIPSSFLVTDKFPAGFPHWQDTHLILRLLAKHPFFQLNTYTYIYRIHQEMGSVKLFNKAEFLARMKLNLAAISDLFDQYENQVKEFLPKETEKFLLAEKQLQYAASAIKVLGRTESIKLFFGALKIKPSLRFWKNYLIYVITFIRPSFFSK